MMNVRLCPYVNTAIAIDERQDVTNGPYRGERPTDLRKILDILATDQTA
jgi:hypothetical protein